jgi:hypothetical protein
MATTCDRTSYYLLGGVCVGSRLGWTWTWLLRNTKLKTCCREVQFQAVVFSVVTILKLVSFAGRTFRCLLLRGPSALPVLHSRLAILSGKRV